MTHAGVAIALVATTIYNVGFVLEKRALTYLPVIDAHRIWSLLRTLFTARGWLAGFALILIGMVLQLVVLSLEPLTVAQPLQASGVVVTILLSRLVLRKRLGGAPSWCIAVLVIWWSWSACPVGRSAAGTHADGLAVFLAALPGFVASLVIYWSAQREPGRHQPPGVRPYPLRTVRRTDVRGGRAGPQGAVGLVFSGGRTHSLLIAAALSPYLYVALACMAAGLCLFQSALQRSPASIVVPVGAIISTGYLIVIGRLFQ